MSTFTVELLSPQAREHLDEVVSFLGADESGEFSLLAHHERFLTVLIPGLARLRRADGNVEYLAQPGAVAHFAGNNLAVTTREFLRGPDPEALGRALETYMAAEGTSLREAHAHLIQLEHEMLRRMWQLQRKAL